MTKRVPLVIAHRGDSHNAPENTLAAFKMALDKGADGVEFDVQLSRDGVPMVIHDHDLSRTAGTSARVAELTADELSKVDVGLWFNGKYPKRQRPEFRLETIPTLETLLNTLRDISGPTYIELKCGETDYEQTARAVCDVIRDSPLLAQMIVKSFKLATIPAVRHFLPGVQTAALFAPEIMHFVRRKKHIIALAREFGAHQISLHHSLATRKLTALAAEAKMPVTVWTADNTDWIERCRSFRIGSLITNDPAKMLAARGDR